jgi:hypothetical protein
MRIKTMIALLAFAPLMAQKPDAGNAPDPQEKAVSATEMAGLGERLGPPETLAGTILSVNPEEKLVVVKAAHGVPFNFIVRTSTRMQAGAQRLNLADLATRINSSASVRFVPTRRGNVARSIDISE